MCDAESVFPLSASLRPYVPAFPSGLRAHQPGSRCASRRRSSRSWMSVSLRMSTRGWKDRNKTGPIANPWFIEIDPVLIVGALRTGREIVRVVLGQQLPHMVCASTVAVIYFNESGMPMAAARVPNEGKSSYTFRARCSRGIPLQARPPAIPALMPHDSPARCSQPGSPICIVSG